MYVPGSTKILLLSKCTHDLSITQSKIEAEKLHDAIYIHVKLFPCECFEGK